MGCGGAQGVARKDKKFLRVRGEGRMGKETESIERGGRGGVGNRNLWEEKGINSCYI